MSDVKSNSIELRELFSDFSFSEAIGKQQVLDITLDSRNIKVGSVFVALQGTKTNREDFIPEAFSRGAIAVVKEARSPEHIQSSEPEYFEGDEAKAILPVVSLRSKVGVIASHFFRNPSDKLCLVGVTGTNGKTSCAELLAQLWRAQGLKAASLGTLGWSIEKKIYQSTGLTTADAIENQRLMRKFLDSGVTHVAMEVSSHAIDQGRIEALNFDARLLTNISRDHLDYHGSMESYAKTKLGFILGETTFSIINIDDKETLKWLSKDEQSKVVGFSVNNSDAEYWATNVKYRKTGIFAEFVTPSGKLQLDCQLIGVFNLYNLIAVVSVYLETCKEKKSIAALEKAITNLTPVEGRVERVLGRKLVFVDYAHTPDALENVLQALRLHCQEKIILVFGCGGDRDRGKRSMMAEIAERYASEIFVTNDNPRSENPITIIDEICAGFSSQAHVIKEPNRRLAIKAAIKSAGAEDIVLIAGKGHEKYQEINGERSYFSDAEEASRLIA